MSRPSLPLPLPPEAGEPAPRGREVGGDDAAFLRSAAAPAAGPARARLSFVDLFSGCGGLSLGVREALREAGVLPRVAAAVDNFAAANAVYDDNFGAGSSVDGDVAALMPTEAGAETTAFETATLARASGRIGLVVGGPPCQGHSDLNNYTRRNDPKNQLYLHMARAATAFAPDAVLIENVQGSPHDKSGVVGRTVALLTEAGYNVDAELVDLSRIGVAQRRKRFIILATRRPAPPIAAMLKPFETPARDLRWAIGDLEDATAGGLDRAVAKPSKDNQRRIDHLFDHGLFDLPNAERPPCHRDKKHAYNSVYGRMHWDRPAQTVTGGFYSNCMGRYVHPSRRRTLTGREAARLQFFPDSFRFDAAGSRTALAKIVGNAVPMKLTWALVTEMLRLGVLRADGADA